MPDPAPPDPAPLDPAPARPAPAEPAPVDPPLVRPVPVDPALVDPPPLDPAPVDSAPVDPAPLEPAPAARRHRHNPLIYFWVYSLARVGLFLALWGVLWLFRLGGLVGAAVALVLSVPLSYVFLVRPRMAMTAAMTERLNVRQERTAELDDKLSGVDDET